MRKNHVLTRPTKWSELTFEELYDQISDDWQYKARRLQIRRWRALKQSLKGGGDAAG